MMAGIFDLLEIMVKAERAKCAERVAVRLQLLYDGKARQQPDVPRFKEPRHSNSSGPTQLNSKRLYKIQLVHCKAEI